VLPISSMSLTHPASDERVPSGIARLDAMMGGLGYFKGSSVLISGTAGSGKSSVAAQFVDAGCRRGERCLYFAFEESQNQILRNMKSIGIDLKPWVDQGLLRFVNRRPTVFGLEMHLVAMHEAIEEFGPALLVVDPISNLVGAGSDTEVKSMLSRLVDYLKVRQITALSTDLTTAGGSLDRTEVGISSLMDTWILLQNLDVGGERNRGLYILKSRGMDHSNQIREFFLSPEGVQLRDVYLGSGGVLTGSARIAQESRERAAAMEHSQEIERRQREMDRKRIVLEAQIRALQSELEAEQEDVARLIQTESRREASQVQVTRDLGESRMADRDSDEGGV